MDNTELHRHCQATVLSANGMGQQDGLSWNFIDCLQLTNLPSDWKGAFKTNTKCITQDLAEILKLVNQVAGDSVKTIIMNGGRYPSQNGTINLGSISKPRLRVENRSTINNDGIIATIIYDEEPFPIKMPTTTTIPNVSTPNGSVGNTCECGFDSNHIYNIFFDKGNATSIEFTSKTIYKGQTIGRLPRYVVNGRTESGWKYDGESISSGSLFDFELNTTDITLTPAVTANQAETQPTIDDLFDIIYPVGSVYITVGSTLPVAFTSNNRQWEQLATGKTLWNVDGGDENLGEEIEAGLPALDATVKITGSTNDAGGHTHQYQNALKVYEVSAYKDWDEHGFSSYNGNYPALYQTKDTTTNGNHSHTINVDSKITVSGGLYGASETVQPPAIGVTMWKRTA